MAGHYKQELGYFVTQKSFLISEEFLLLRKKFGDFAYKMYVIIYSEIAVNSYYMDASPHKVARLLSIENMAPKKFDEALKLCLDAGIFNMELYIKHQILTSRKIQEAWIRESKNLRRQGIVINEDFMLVDKAWIDHVMKNTKYKYESSSTEKISPRDGIMYALQAMEPKGSAGSQIMIGDVEVKKNKIKVVKPENKVDVPAKIVSSQSVEESVSEARRICSIPYEKHSDLFKSMHTKSWFNAYVALNKDIDEDFPQIRNSAHQLMLDDLKKLKDFFNYDKKDFWSVTAMIAGNDINEGTVMFSKYIGYFSKQIPEKGRGKYAPEKTEVKDKFNFNKEKTT